LPFTTCMGYSGTILSRSPHGITVLLVPSLIPSQSHACFSLHPHTTHISGPHSSSCLLTQSHPIKPLNGSSMTARTIPHNSFTRVGQFPLSDSLQHINMNSAPSNNHTSTLKTETVCFCETYYLQVSTALRPEDQYRHFF
jgi:hypothetical protein